MCVTQQPTGKTAWTHQYQSRNYSKTMTSQTCLFTTHSVCRDKSIHKTHDIYHTVASDCLLHAMGFFILEIIELVGHIPEDMTAPAQRNCLMCCSSRVYKFREYCLKEFNDNNLFGALHKLTQSYNKKKCWTKEMQKK